MFECLFQLFSAILKFTIANMGNFKVKQGRVCSNQISNLNSIIPVNPVGALVNRPIVNIFMGVYILMFSCFRRCVGVLHAMLIYVDMWGAVL